MIRIQDAMQMLDGTSESTVAFEILKSLQPYEAKPWLRLESWEYVFGTRLYDNRRWFDPQGQLLPPNATFLGIVLDKVLEGCIVETVGSGVKYHRPMVVLGKGSVFGTFETADLMARTESLSDNTIYAGLRTFFYSPEPSAERLRPVVKQKAKFAEWCQRDLSPTQRPGLLLEAILDEDLRKWKARILLINIGSEFLDNAPSVTKELIWRNAWSQSAHMRRQAINAYNSDPLLDILRSRRSQRDAYSSGSIPDAHRFAVGRELRSLSELVAERRPGFRELPVEDTIAFGPFLEFAHALEEAFPIRTVFVPQLLYDRLSELIFPLWPNCDPRCGTTHKHDGGPEILKNLKSEEEAQSSKWEKVIDLLFSGDLFYSRKSIRLDLALPRERATGALFLRGAVKIDPTPVSLPIFKVPTRREQASGRPLPLIAVQHLLEETLLLIKELLERGIAEGGRIYVLGKPYSSNRRIAYRLSQLGVTVRIPGEGTWFAGGAFSREECESWKAGNFESWFQAEVGSFFTDAVQRLNDGSRVILLDDGGKLQTAAANCRTKKFKFYGVEQTTRGISAAENARYPVVVVACSLIKSIVEPEFVSRGAVKQIAQYYPEALAEDEVGIIGLGNIGSYFLDYIVHRHDIHHAVKVFAYDTDPERRPDSSHCWERCTDVASVFRKAGVVYGCSGMNLGDDARKWGRVGQLLISLTSGDVEFSSLLRKPKKEGPTVAKNGFPITFDGSASQAPLVETQLTRALLLAAIEQVLVESDPGPKPLDSDAQWCIWEFWRDHVLQSNDDSFAWWRELRAAELKGSELHDIALRVGRREEFDTKNVTLFNNATGRRLRRR